MLAKNLPEIANVIKPGKNGGGKGREKGGGGRGKKREKKKKKKKKREEGRKEEYCLEQADNGESLHNLWLPTDAPFTTFEGKGLFSHKILIQAPGYRYEQSNPEQQPLWHYEARQPNASRKL